MSQNTVELITKHIAKLAPQLNLELGNRTMIETLTSAQVQFHELSRQLRSFGASENLALTDRPFVVQAVVRVGVDSVLHDADMVTLTFNTIEEAAVIFSAVLEFVGKSCPGSTNNGEATIDFCVHLYTR